MTTASKGFTIAELVVVTALTAVLMLVGVEIYLTNNKFSENQTSKISAINAVREIADRIYEYGRPAQSLVASYTYNSDIYSTGAETVIFEIPSIDAVGALIPSAYDHAIISVDPDNAARLMLFVDPAGSSARPARSVQLTDHLTLASFTYDSADPAAAAEVTFQVRVTEGIKNPATEQVYGEVFLRNK